MVMFCLACSISCARVAGEHVVLSCCSCAQSNWFANSTAVSVSVLPHRTKCPSNALFQARRHRRGHSFLFVGGGGGGGGGVCFLPQDRKLQMAGCHERKQMAKFAKHGLKYEKGKQLVKALREAQTKTITAHVETVTERQTQALKRHLDEAVAAVEQKPRSCALWMRT